MAQKTTKRQRFRPSRTASCHTYRNGQQPNQWIIPLTADHMPVIYHGHTDPDDHSGCGPQLFCCGRSLGLYLASYQHHLPDDVTFRFYSGTEVYDSFRAMTPPMIYFYACDPVNQQRAYFLPVPEQNAWDIIQFFVPIETVLIGAEVIV